MPPTSELYQKRPLERESLTTSTSQMGFTLYHLFGALFTNQSIPKTDWALQIWVENWREVSYWDRLFYDSPCGRTLCRKAVWALSVQNHLPLRPMVTRAGTDQSFNWSNTSLVYASVTYTCFVTRGGHIKERVLTRCNTKYSSMAEVTNYC